MAASVALVAPTFAARPQTLKATPSAASASGKLSPAERGAMTRAYVRKWGPYVQQVYGVQVEVWAQRMVPSFIHADPDNFRSALQRTTYEGASAALGGVGKRLSDSQVIDSMARASLDPRLTQADAGTMALGSATSDVVYTPITPCRIFDTRVVGGPIAATFSRDFNAVVGGGGNFSSQGGSATDCGAVAAGQAAVVINLTAVAPAAAGFATAHPFGTTRPLASSVNCAAGAVVNNTIVVKLPSPLTTKDFSVYTFATSNYVADIVGYYSPPAATALDCTTRVAAPTNVSAGGYVGLPLLTCPANYTAVAQGFNANENVVLADTYMTANQGQVFVRSLSVSAQNVTSTLNCCRVPGR